MQDEYISKPVVFQNICDLEKYFQASLAVQQLTEFGWILGQKFQRYNFQVGLDSQALLSGAA